MATKKQLLEAGQNVFDMADAIVEYQREYSEDGYISTEFTRNDRTFSVFVLEPAMARVLRRVTKLYVTCDCFWDAVEEAAAKRQEQKRDCVYKQGAKCVN